VASESYSVPKKRAASISPPRHPTAQSVHLAHFPAGTIAVLSVALIVVTAGVYSRTFHNTFINYDDPSYVTGNPHVQQGLTLQTILWAFTATDASNWHPVTWLSHTLDYQLFGPVASGHHMTSLVFHIGNTILLFLLLVQMTRRTWQSALVAALFALHPLHVESVAWIAERRDVLSTFFLVLTALAYVKHVRHPRPYTYALVIIAFALGLMSKPMLVTVPFVLLLLDYWPLNRTRLTAPTSVFAVDISQRFVARQSVAQLLAEKIPLFALAASSSVITFIVQRAAGSGQRGRS